MKIDTITINRICNSLNAQSGSARHEYAATGDKRSRNQSEIMDQAQVLIRMLEENHPELQDIPVNTRPSWDEYFTLLAKTVATRSTCLRRQVGALFVRDRQILCTGYNGSPSGLVHCDKIGCLRESLGAPSGERHEICRAVHAEQNAIVQAAKHGVALVGADLYVTHQPCILCTKMLINIGVRRIVYIHPYPDPLANEMSREVGLELVMYPEKRVDG